MVHIHVQGNKTSVLNLATWCLLVYPVLLLEVTMMLGCIIIEQRLYYSFIAYWTQLLLTLFWFPTFLSKQTIQWIFSASRIYPHFLNTFFAPLNIFLPTFVTVPPVIYDNNCLASPIMTYGILDCHNMLCLPLPMLLLVHLW